MIRIIEENLLNSKCDYIAHQTNCLGIAGAGVALAIRKKFPRWYQEYYGYCKKHQHDILGTIQIIDRVINVFGQYGISRYEQQTDYNALRLAFIVIYRTIPHGSSIAFPYGFGCGLAGGEWNIVYHLIEKMLSPYFDIYLYKLKK